MNCEEIKILIIDYIDKKLEAVQLQDFESHLSSCSSCKDELEETKQILEHMNKTEIKQPSAKLKTAFYKMLEEQKDKNQSITKVEPEIVPYRDYVNQQSKSERSLNFYRVAAAVAILITGFLTGYMFNPNNSKEASEMAEIKNEMVEMKAMFFAQLNEESPSQRIAAVQELEQFSKPDQTVTASLIKAMKEDENINVRTAAANALLKYAHDENVKNALIEALDEQKEPLMQITLINILVELDDQRALQPMSKLMFNDSTMEVVRTQAEQGIRILAK